MNIKIMPLTILMFLGGSLLHFGYNFTGKNSFVAIFCPINESIWEHGKIAFFPLVIGLILQFFWRQNQCIVDNIDRWLTATVISAILSLVIMPMIYYWYFSGFSIHNLWVDIALLFVILLISNLIFWHLYLHLPFASATVSISAMITVVILFTIFSFNPPKLPIFISN